MLEVDAIFFDVDGTLLDARQDIVNAVNYTLKRSGYPERAFGDIVAYIGTGVKDLLAKSLGDSDPVLIDKVLPLFDRYYGEHAIDTATLYPNVKETLESLSAKKKYIITNRFARFADSALSGLGIRRYFEGIIGGDDDLCMKPSGCVVTRALSKYGILKSRALMVGDMDIDIMTGRNGGIATCFVTYGLGTLDQVKALFPDFVIDDISELTGIIK